QRIRDNLATLEDYNLQAEHELRKQERKIFESPSSNQSKLPNFEIITSSLLEDNGLNAHQIKQEELGKSADIDKFDLYRDKNSGDIYILEKGGKGPGIKTDYKIGANKE
ncbi:MAG: polymorphic toxin type 33 domain-containing protein, partial [Flavobacteriales bacterium]